ncbi:hypothetical protein KCV87_18260 [Actinosynnema pretiosum subsp. pretiosum]|uniref:Uncharacterized protein n=2 Tax=Actinosynnema TaxID=40566 RepID=C6WHX1_ACTMD|nr:hypothetical protein [Actinosynnema mirum]ACU34422.1 hypothetical protein Amir_0455 [Actinosynnema mirum DSM 43827]AXX27794.1 hypothetical protein APASM_0429 [Actinosynnema pretiosum subsp. pretiosum]QUF01514.1 hypothetical protein KCV87_18260 [Actinosynnema pretiosum subsp. pretiosum]
MRESGWLIGAAALVLAGGWLLAAPTAGEDLPSAGDCASFVGTADAPGYAALDCGAEQANARVLGVADVADACPGSDARPTAGGAVCLGPNLVAGHCYRDDLQMGLVRVTCDTFGAVKVLKVANSTFPCEEGDLLTLGDRSIAFCVTRAADSR